MKRRGPAGERTSLGEGDAPASLAATARRFFTAESPSGDRFAVRGELAHRLTRVLRLPPGERIQVLDGSGRVWPATIASVTGGVVQLEIGPEERALPEPRTELLAGLIRPARFEWLIEKATELGATLIQPVLCARSAVRPAEIGRARLERWRRIATEAAEQCGRATVPTLGEPVPLFTALHSPEGRLYVAAEPAHGDTPPLGLALRGVDNGTVSLVTGPEGGLTADELAAVIAAGGQAVSLGPLVLRAETAAIAALSVLVDARRSAG